MSSYYSDNVKKRREEFDKKLQAEADGITKALKGLLTTREGLEVMSWLLERAGVFRVDYNGRALDLAFNAGQKSLGNELFTMLLDADPEFLSKFHKHKKEKDKENENG